MDASVIEFIQTVGFPIAACVVLYYSNEKNNERHREEVNELSKAIDNNTIVMTQILERMKKNE